LGSLFVFSPAHADLTTGLVAQYSFDDCTAKDNSGNGHDGTINGNPQCVDGVKGKAFSFDGVNFIDLGDMNYLPTKSLTFSLWVKKEQSGRVEGFFGKWNTSPFTNNSFLIYNGESFYVDYPTIAFNFDSSGNTGWNAKNKIISNVFTHLVFTWSNETGLLSIYQNGKLDVTYENVGKGEQLLNKPLSYTAKIGNWGEIHGTTHEFIGVTDDLRIYNRALTEVEVMELYKGTQSLSGNINGVQKYSAVCKNTKTSVTKKIAMADGAKEWNCKTAGLQTKKGDIVTVTITGVSQ
jgi:hypothetical protein